MKENEEILENFGPISSKILWCFFNLRNVWVYFNFSEIIDFFQNYLYFWSFFECFPANLIGNLPKVVKSWVILPYNCN